MTITQLCIDIQRAGRSCDICHLNNTANCAEVHPFASLTTIKGTWRTCELCGKLAFTSTELCEACDVGY